MPVVVHSKVAPEPFKGGATYQTLVGDEKGSTPIRVGIQTSPPGYRTPLHSHPYLETITVLEGQGEAWLQGREELVRLAARRDARPRAEPAPLVPRHRRSRRSGRMACMPRRSGSSWSTTTRKRRRAGGVIPAKAGTQYAVVRRMIETRMGAGPSRQAVPASALSRTRGAGMTAVNRTALIPGLQT